MSTSHSISNTEAEDPFLKLTTLTDSTNKTSSGLQNSIHGILYQLKLLMLFLCRAVNKGYSFRLTTEWDAAEKFDDLVFAYEENERLVYRFLQAKHKLNTEGQNSITERNLFHEKNGDFDVEKYFVSYRKIKRNSVFIGDNVILKDFIISTNTDLDPSAEHLFTRLSDFDEILDTQGCASRRLKFNNNAKDKLRLMLQRCSDVGQLAVKISECVYKNKRFDLQDELFKKYRHFLVDNVINVETCKFTDHFFDSEELVQIRNIFLDNLQIFDGTINIGNVKKLTSVVELKTNASGCFEYSSSYLHNKYSKFISLCDEAEVKLFCKTKLQIRKEFKSAETNGVSGDLIHLLNKSIGTNEIEDFLERFVLAVGQPNEVKLTEIISNELDKNFNITTINDELSYNKLLSVMLDWLKNKQKQFLGHSEGREFLKHIQQNLDSVKLHVLTTQHEDRIRNLNLNFQPEDLELITSTIIKSQVINIINPVHVLLSAAKLYQIFKSSANFGPRIYLNSNQFTDTRHCVENILHNGKVKLIAIECDCDDIFEIYEIYKWLIKIADLMYDVTIILITTSNQRLPMKIIEQLSDYIELRDEKNCFNNITPQSQEHYLRSTKVEFYGKIVPLSQLIPMDLYEHVPLEIAFNSGDKTICIGTSYEVHPAPAYYIQQNCVRCIKIRKEIYEDTENFIIFRSKDEFVIDTNKDVLFVADKKSSYDNFCDNNKYNNIHWVLEEYVGSLKWQETRGEIRKIRNYLTDTFTVNHQVSTIYDIDDKLVIISGKAGMGKSMLLSHVLDNMRNKNDGFLWVEKINLLDYSTIFKSLKDTEVNEIAVQKFLHNAFNLTNDSFSKVLFDYYYNNNEVILLLDGFDEISPDYKSQVLNILRFVKRKAKRLWITSRPYDFLNELEDELSTIPYVLQPFDSAQVQTFLKLFWSNDVENLKHEQFTVFLNEIVKLFTMRTEDYEEEFMKIPLQTSMFGQVFKEMFINFHSTENTTVPNCYVKQIRSKLNLVLFYREFIRMKLAEKTPDLNRDKPNLGAIYKNAESALTNVYMDLALRELISSENLEKLLQGNVQRFHKAIERYNIVEEKFGIIDRVVDGIPRFIHRTLAEYFCALWFSQNFDQRNASEFLRVHLFKQEFHIIAQFLNNMLVIDCEDTVAVESHNLVLNNDFEELSNAKMIMGKDRGGRSILHVVAFCGSKQTMNALSEILKPNESYVDTKDDFLQLSPLSYAVLLQKWDRCEFLLRLGAKNHEIRKYLKNISFREDLDEMKKLLFLAIRNGYIELLKIYIENGEWFVGKLSSLLMLHSAIKYEHLQVVQYLTTTICDVNEEDEKGNSALHVAVASGNLQIFSWLLENGAGKKSYENILSFALKTKQSTIALFLFESLNNSNSQFVQSVSNTAVVTGNLAFVKHLIAKGVDMRMVAKNGRTLLHEAGILGNQEIVRCLVEAGVDVNATDKRNRTALHYVLEMDTISRLFITHGSSEFYFSVLDTRMQISKYLIANGINVNIADEDGLTALHIAAQWNQLKIAIHLINVGINLAAQSNQGQTAFHIAVHRNNLKIAQYMLNHGYDVNTKDSFNRTALHVFAKSGTSRNVTYLIIRGINRSIEDDEGKTAQYIAIENNNIAAFKCLIESNCEATKKFEIKNTDGRTALHIAAQYDSIAIGEYLVNNGIDVNLRDNNGISAIHVAAQHGRLEFVKFLLRVGGRSDIIDENGHTARWHAVANKKDNVELLELLR